MKRKTIFIKTINTNVTVCGVEYSIHQDAQKQSLIVKIKETGEPIYTYDTNDTYVLKYKKSHLEIIAQVFEMANIDRYVL